MNNPEASSAAAVGQSVQASRDFAPEDPRRGSFQRPGQDVGFGVRRGHSDGEILQAWHNVSNSMSAGQGSGSSLHRVPSVELPTQNSTPNRPPPPARRESWHEHSRNNTEGSDNLQVFLNNLGTQDDPRSHRARQQAIALMHEQRKRMMQQEIQARRRATTSMMSPPNHQAVGMRRDRPQTGDNRRANRASYPGIVIPQYPPPRPAQYYSNQGGVQQRQEHILPRWQPDSEVSSCPICHHPFSFFFRKHHCRKCGRVVCAQCSPHRITIPRQFIVHPPAEDGIFGTDASGDSDEGNAVAALSPTGLPNSALGGGEEVRLCNPCVPDPNPLPPPPYHSPQNNRYSALPRQDPPSWQGPGWPPSPLAQDANFVSPRRSVHTDTMERQANAAAIRRSELNTQTPLRHPHVRCLVNLPVKASNHSQARQSSQIVQGNPYRPTPPSPHGSMQDNRSAVCNKCMDCTHMLITITVPYRTTSASFTLPSPSNRFPVSLSSTLQFCLHAGRHYATSTPWTTSTTSTFTRRSFQTTKTRGTLVQDP